MSPETSFKDLPLDLQYAISSKLGLEKSDFHFQPDGDDFVANSAGFAYQITEDGKTISTYKDYHWTMWLDLFGRPSKFTTVDGGKLVLEQSNRLEWEAKGITLCWANGPAGLQQSWIISERPTGSENIELHFSHSAPQAKADPTRLILPHGIEFSGLLAHDTAGKKLPISFDIRDNKFILSVDDTDALYPIIIDPRLGINEDHNEDHNTDNNVRRTSKQKIHAAGSKPTPPKTIYHPCNKENKKETGLSGSVTLPSISCNKTEAFNAQKVYDWTIVSSEHRCKIGFDIDCDPHEE